MTTTIFSIRRRLLLLLAAGLAALAMLALTVILIAVPLTRRVLAVLPTRRVLAVPLTRRGLVVAVAEWMLVGRLESLAVDRNLQPKPPYEKNRLSPRRRRPQTSDSMNTARQSAILTP
jgi:hypothetical protein